MITYQVDEWKYCWQELFELSPEHYEEIALDKERMKLEPDFDKYWALDNIGSLFITTARNEGKVVGYWILFVTPHLHYKNTLVAFTDIYYLSQEHRKGMAGVKLIKEGEKFLKKRGVKKIFCGDKKHKNLGILFDHLGWNAVETQYSKWIGE